MLYSFYNYLLRKLKALEYIDNCLIILYNEPTYKIDYDGGSVYE